MPPNGATGSGRGRGGARRRVDDDSAYIGASGLGRKRQAVVEAVGTNASIERAKRKRVEGTEKRVHFMDFNALGSHDLHRYLIAWDVVPPGLIAGSLTDPVPADVHEQLARAVERHFLERSAGNELDVLTTFLLAVNRGKPLPSAP